MRAHLGFGQLKRKLRGKPLQSDSLGFAGGLYLRLSMQPYSLNGTLRFVLEALFGGTAFRRGRFTQRCNFGIQTAQLAIDCRYLVAGIGFDSFRVIDSLANFGRASVEEGRANLP